MNRLLVTLPLLGLALNTPFARATAPAPAAPIQKHETETRQKHETETRQKHETETRHRQTEAAGGYLGVAIEAVPEAVHSQLAGVLPAGEGVMVSQVTKDSPAAKAGLKTYDILHKYGDTTLTSPESLMKLTRGDKAGKEVTIAYIRGGKAETCKVTLGEYPAAPAHSGRRHIFRLGPDNLFRRTLKDIGGTDDIAAWESFDAIRLSRVEGDNWRAEIDYRAKDGKKQHNEFQGTREQIAKDIQAMKDMPDNEREHLLRALNMNQPAFEFHFPPVDIPDLGHIK